MAVEARHAARIFHQVDTGELTQTEAMNVLRALDDGVRHQTPEEQSASARAIRRHLRYHQEADANRDQRTRIINAPGFDLEAWTDEHGT